MGPGVRLTWCRSRRPLTPLPRCWQSTADGGRIGGSDQLLEADAVAELGDQLGLLVVVQGRVLVDATAGVGWHWSERIREQDRGVR